MLRCGGTGIGALVRSSSHRSVGTFAAAARSRRVSWSPAARTIANASWTAPGADNPWIMGESILK